METLHAFSLPRYSPARLTVALPYSPAEAATRSPSKAIDISEPAAPRPNAWGQVPKPPTSPAMFGSFDEHLLEELHRTPAPAQPPLPPPQQQHHQQHPMGQQYMQQQHYVQQQQGPRGYGQGPYMQQQMPPHHQQQQQQQQAPPASQAQQQQQQVEDRTNRPWRPGGVRVPWAGATAITGCSRASAHQELSQALLMYVWALRSHSYTRRGSLTRRRFAPCS